MLRRHLQNLLRKIDYSDDEDGAPRRHDADTRFRRHRRHRSRSVAIEIAFSARTKSADLILAIENDGVHVLVHASDAQGARLRRNSVVLKRKSNANALRRRLRRRSDIVLCCHLRDHRTLPVRKAKSGQRSMNEKQKYCSGITHHLAGTLADINRRARN